MATDMKSEKERSVEERLKSLYELQTIFSEIDRIKTLRGELPNEVKDLEDDIVRYQTRIQKYRDEITSLKKQIQQKTGEIQDRQAKIERYREQQDNVRNNREIELAEKNIREYTAAQEARNQDIAKAEEELADGQHILAEKRAELEDIVSETKAEEENLRVQAQALEPLIDAYTLAAFKRIRKNARNGLGIVTVQRNACGGCFNRIPPQRQLEIKMHKKVIVCEYCGRIIIDGVLAGIEEPIVPEPTPKKRGASRG